MNDDVFECIGLSQMFIFLFFPFRSCCYYREQVTQNMNLSNNREEVWKSNVRG